MYCEINKKLIIKNCKIEYTVIFSLIVFFSWTEYFNDYLKKIVVNKQIFFRSKHVYIRTTLIQINWDIQVKLQKWNLI